MDNKWKISVVNNYKALDEIISEENQFDKDSCKVNAEKKKLKYAGKPWEEWQSPKTIDQIFDEMHPLQESISPRPKIFCNAGSIVIKIVIL